MYLSIVDYPNFSINDLRNPCIAIHFSIRGSLVYHCRWSRNTGRYLGGSVSSFSNPLRRCA